MLNFVTIALALVAISRATPFTPTGPSPGQSFISGQDCLIQWDADSDDDAWKTTYVELMTGDNIQMVHLTTVTSFDGTDPSKNSFTYKCPDVTLPSAVYFYQFTSTASDSPMWTGRFAISANGTLVPPPNPTQPNGDAKPWGTGALVNAADAKPPPPTAPPGQLISNGTASTTSPSSPPAAGNATSSQSGAPTSNTGAVSTPSAAANLTSSSTPSNTTPSPTGSSNTTGSAAALGAAPLGTVLLGLIAAAFLGGM